MGKVTAEVSKHPKRDEWTIKLMNGPDLVSIEYAITEARAYQQAREMIAVWPGAYK